MSESGSFPPTERAPVLVSETPSPASAPESLVDASPESKVPEAGPPPADGWSNQGVSLSPEQASKYGGIQGIVRGGTTTSAYDNALAASMADAEKRRAADDAEHRLAKIPVEQGGALMFQRDLAPQMTSPRVAIKYVGKGKDEINGQLCELVVDDSSGKEEHMLIFVCPACFERGVPTGFAQCHVKSSHRKWHVDTRLAGQIMAVRNSDAPSGQEFYTSAGVIMDTDTLRCDNVNCGAAFKIHNNIMYRV